MNVFKKGLLGEWRAAWYLRFRGIKILEKRYRTAHGEIDLIGRDGKTTVFVEVKYRPRGKMGEGFDAVNARKRGHIRYAAALYLQKHPAEDVRFDVVEISSGGVRHLKNAF